VSLESPTRGTVCGACWAAIVPFTPPLCGRCGEPLPSWRTISLETGICSRCRRAPSSIDSSAAIGAYDGRLRFIIHALKYGGHRSIAAPLGARMRSSGAAVLQGADAAVPVPLHRRRQRARGFNQAADLARHLDLPVAPLLRRVRATPSQTTLPAAERRANMRGAFALSRRTSVSGMRLVLVDDVSTTGATLEACASVLKDAGAIEVRAITAARVESRRPG
jgi:ComF family protein